jgi:hypothetical protein
MAKPGAPSSGSWLVSEYKQRTGGDRLKSSTLARVKNTVNIMGDKYWSGMADHMSALENEFDHYLKDVNLAEKTISPLRQLFVDLTISSCSVASAKYSGYLELMANADAPELLDSIAAKNADEVKKLEEKQNDIALGISEVFFMLRDLQERIMEIGSNPLSVPSADDSAKTA